MLVHLYALRSIHSSTSENKNNWIKILSILIKIKFNLLCAQFFCWQLLILKRFIQFFDIKFSNVVLLVANDRLWICAIPRMQVAVAKIVKPFDSPCSLPFKPSSRPLFHCFTTSSKGWRRLFIPPRSFIWIPIVRQTPWRVISCASMVGTTHSILFQKNSYIHSKTKIAIVKDTRIRF